MKSVDRKFDDESLKGVRQTAKSINKMPQKTSTECRKKHQLL